MKANSPCKSIFFFSLHPETKKNPPFTTKSDLRQSLNEVLCNEGISLWWQESLARLLALEKSVCLNKVLPLPSKCPNTRPFSQSDVPSSSLKTYWLSPQRALQYYMRKHVISPPFFFTFQALLTALTLHEIKIWVFSAEIHNDLNLVPWSR